MASAITYEGDVQRSDHNPNESNGAQIVQDENQADIRIADHARKNQKPGLHSYRYVEYSIRNGQLEDLDAHRIGSAARVERPVGSIVTSSKGTRNPFTDAEDQLLWNWVKPFQDAGGPWKGNEIYQQLEKQYPQHTYQSWRDRWIKKTQFLNKQVTNDPRVRGQNVTSKNDDNPRPAKRQKSSKQISIPTTIAGDDVSQTMPVSPTSRTTYELQVPKHKSQTMPPPEVPRDVQQPRNSTNIIVERASDIPNWKQIVLNEDAPDSSPKTFQKPSPSTDDSASIITKIYDVLPQGFTRKNLLELLKAAPYILDTRPDVDLDKIWTHLATQEGGEMEKWKEVFYHYVLPGYKQIHNLTTEEELQAHIEAEIRSHPDFQQPANVEKHSHKNVRANESDPGPSLKTMLSIAPGLVEEPDLSIKKLDASVSAGGHAYLTMNNLQSNSTGTHDVLVDQADNHRPPQPNESRKLDQSKSSQSSSTQSQSQPRTTPSGSSYQLSPQSTNLKRKEVAKALANSQVSTSSDLVPKKQSLASDVELTISHPSVSTPRKPRKRSASPRTPLSKSNVADQNRRPIPDTESSPLNVQLVDEEDGNSDIDLSSDIAPSEASSEPNLFENYTAMSDIWETAPEEDQEEEDGDMDITELQAEFDQYHAAEDHIPLNKENLDRVAVTIEQKTLQTDPAQVKARLSIKRDGMYEVESMSEEFETAPQSIRPTSDDTDSTSTETEHKVQKRPNTQMLFEQPTQADPNDPFAVPEPVGGWGHAEIVLTQVGAARNASVSKDDLMERDWTLPFPNPTPAHIDHTPSAQPPTIPEIEADLDIDVWLNAQASQNKHVPSDIINAFSHHALISTSMTITIATKVLSYMIQELQSSSNDPTLNTNTTTTTSPPTLLKYLTSLSKRERKKLLSEAARDVTPTDLSGCWTPEDDDALRSGNGRAIDRVERKHGADAFRLRWEFLEEWEGGS